MTRKNAAAKIAALMTMESVASMDRHEFLMAYAYLMQHAYGRQVTRRRMRGFTIHRSGSRYSVRLNGTYFQGKSSATTAYDVLRRTDAYFLFHEADDLRSTIYTDSLRIAA